MDQFVRQLRTRGWRNQQKMGGGRYLLGPAVASVVPGSGLFSPHVCGLLAVVSRGEGGEASPWGRVSRPSCSVLCFRLVVSLLLGALLVGALLLDSLQLGSLLLGALQLGSLLLGAALGYSAKRAISVCTLVDEQDSS